MSTINLFVDAQIATLQSQRVIDLATSDPAWQALGRGSTAEAQYRFAQSLEITGDNDIISIKALDPSPIAAMISVKSLIAAYLKVYDEDNAEIERSRFDALDAYQQKLTEELNVSTQSIQDDSTPFGPDGLTAQCESQLAEFNKLDEKVGGIQHDLSSLALKPSEATGINLDEDLTPPEIAMLDTSGKMSRLLAEQEACVDAIRRLQMADMLEDNPAMQAVKINEELATQAVEKYANEFKAMRSAALTDPAKAPAEVAQNPDDLRKQFVEYQKLRDDAKDKLVQLSEQREKVDELKTAAAETRKRLDEVYERTEELRVEENLKGRIAVNGEPTQPVVPLKDTRPSFAGAGGAGGALLGLGIVVLIGMLDRRLRSADDTETRINRRPILGLVPVLPTNLIDSAEMEQAAHSVHEIRILLQIWNKGQRQQAFAITSATSGAGKTSLALALGLSFASAGRKTLMIDCDLKGGGLTRAVNQMFQPRLGKMLREKGLVNQEQIDEALNRIKGSGRQIGEVLGEMGVLKPSESEAAVMEIDVGLREALRGAAIEKCVMPTGVDGLFALPLGRATAVDVATITPEMLGTLIARAKKVFDDVLLDTGPILGCLEASVVTGEADAVILTVSHGEHRNLVEKSMKHLDRVGARLAGVVFNRARSQDMRAYGSSSGRSSDSRFARSKKGERAKKAVSEVQGSAEFGPIAQAVAAYGPKPSGAENEN